jgi:Na+-driven multidrug efflux pump
MLVAGLGIFATYFIAPMVLRATLHDPDTCASAVSFLKVRIWGLPFLYIYQMRNALLVGTNQSRYLVPGTVAEAVTNIVLDYLLIFGFGAWRGLLFEGAAYASIVAEFTGMFVIFLVIRR